MKRFTAFILAVVLLAFGIAFAEGEWTCPDCGETAAGNFCFNCGTPRPSENWICPNCGATAKGNFCSDCAAPRPNESDAAAQSQIRVGDIVAFGTYPQTSSRTDNTPIEWLVLEVRGDEALLISRYALDAVPYNETLDEVTWETCSLRKWLNGVFYHTAFSEKERMSIALAANGNPDNAEGTRGGSATKDKVYLLSLDEAERYFMGDADRVCVATEYAKLNGAFFQKKNDIEAAQPYYAYPLTEGACWWWLRSPGFSEVDAACVNNDGAVSLYGTYVYSVNYCIRPCVRVRFS